jgi:SRSO17 transposase
VRRTIANPDELAYYVVFGPADTSLVTLARVAGQRWKVEECFQAAHGTEVRLTAALP